MDSYIDENSELICEVPIVSGTYEINSNNGKFTTYNIPDYCDHVDNDIVLDDTFEDICLKMSELNEEGINFL